MNFFKKILCRAAPLAGLLLLSGCSGGVPGGTVSEVLMVSTLAGTAGTKGSADGTGAAARFNLAGDIAADSVGNLYVADSWNHTIRKITPAGVVSTLAGTAGTQGSADGTGAAAQFNAPSGIAVDSAGNLYVTDALNNTIRKITPAGGVSTLAGTAGTRGSADGTGAAARFNVPYGIAVDSAGNLYVADSLNRTIRKITPAGVVSTLAGTAGAVTGSADGTGAAARFNGPSNIAVDSAGNLYVTDSNNNTIRKITPAGVVSTLAGKAGVSGSADGTVAVARFDSSAGINIAPNGNIYVADFSNSTIRKIGPGYYVGGTVNGLNGALILLNSNGDNLTINNSNGSFTFDTPVAEGLTYAVTVQTQPAGQNCTVTGGSGTATAHVSDIAVSCTGPGAVAYTIGGTVSGLSTPLIGTLVLKNSNGDKLQTIAANGSFSFTAPVAQAGAYNVSVATQPNGQTCTVTSGGGTANANVSNISVSCAASTYTIGGTVSGLTGTLALQNNGGDTMNLTANAPFTFPTPIVYNGAYNVTVLTQPAGQTCTVRGGLSVNASGTATRNVGTISVSCVTNTIGGSVSGLSGTVVLQDNNGDNLSLTANGSFTFATPVTSGGAYAVTVLTQPAGQTCTVTSGSGTTTAPVTNVAVSCVNSAAPTYTIGGSVSGLSGTVVLQDNNGDNLSLSANAPFTFATAVSGAYNVTVLTQPAGQTCSVTSGSGTASANVTTVAVSCVNNVVTYVVNVTAPSLTSTSVELQNNGGDNLIVYGTGFAAPLTFATPITSGGAYNVTILHQPTNGQTCSVISGSGTSTTDVTITINCI